MIKDTDLAWAAGFIDGEGSIMLASKWDYIMPVLCAYNSDTRALIKLVNLFGGAIQHIKHDIQGRAEYYSWRVGTKRSVEVIQMIRPFLVLKGEQADTILEFSTLKVVSNGKPVPEENLVRRRELRDKIKLLNKRGA